MDNTQVDTAELLRLIGLLYVENVVLRARLALAAQPPPDPPAPPDRSNLDGT